MWNFQYVNYNKLRASAAVSMSCFFLHLILPFIRNLSSDMQLSQYWTFTFSADFTSPHTPRLQNLTRIYSSLALFVNSHFKLRIITAQETIQAYDRFIWTEFSYCLHSPELLFLIFDF